MSQRSGYNFRKRTENIDKIPIRKSITKKKSRFQYEKNKEQPSELDEAVLNKLRKFDLTTKFGPSVGMKRLHRWQRANDLGLKPPIEIKQILDSLQEDSKHHNCIWYGRV
eukprot:TRINITY_DN22998_c0_g2_i3.p2 TRINITY_DN22998_c0_g2~~TRINITY_DN22998_c0_g2_i3.p2  ORF type:complete len:110 (-),score=2.95 TRINITY_DN22998_c0_g2_i3:142-471(-)